MTQNINIKFYNYDNPEKLKQDFLVAVAMMFQQLKHKKQTQQKL
jgi:hypothetical protein